MLYKKYKKILEIKEVISNNLSTVLAIIFVILTLFQAGWVNAQEQNPECDGYERSYCFSQGRAWIEETCTCSYKAIGTTGVGVYTGYKDLKALNKVVAETEDKNIYSLSGNTAYGYITAILAGLCPQCMENYDSVISDSSISDGAKQGTIGIVGNLLAMSYENQITYNVGEHLAMNWVPGYRDNTYASFAQDSEEYNEETDIDCLNLTLAVNIYECIDSCTNADDFLVDNVTPESSLNDFKWFNLETDPLCYKSIKEQDNRDVNAIIFGKEGQGTTVMDMIDEYNDGKFYGEDWKNNPDYAKDVRTYCEKEYPTRNNDIEKCITLLMPGDLEVIKQELDEKIKTVSPYWSLRTDVSDGYDYLVKIGLSSIWARVLLISYALYIVAMIIGGFMIMFRNKIGGQVAVTIYNTIPNIIISLVLATFSFAIVGVILNLSVLLSQFGLAVLGFDTKIISAGNYSYITGLISIPSWYSLAGAIKGGISAEGIGVTDPALHLIIVIWIIIISFKAFFVLVKAFVGIIADTILAPIIMFISAIPGQEKMRKQWLNRIIKNALIFPITLFIINIPNFIKANYTKMYIDFMPLSAGSWNEAITQNASGTNFFGTLIMTLLPIICYHSVSKIPDLLSDYLPTETGKGMQAFIAQAQMPLAKIPILKRIVARE